MKNHNKDDLVKNLALSFPDIDTQDLGTCVDIIINRMIESLSEGKRIEIRKFGNFAVRTRKIAGKEGSYKSVYSKITRELK